MLLAIAGRPDDGDASSRKIALDERADRGLAAPRMASVRTDGPVLVTGAGGKTGRAVIRRLVGAGVPVRAFVRRPRQREALEALGAGEIVDGDLRDREAVARAMRGAGAVYHICPNVHPDEIGIGRLAIDAAREAGLRRFVFHSVLHPQVEAMPHHWAKMRVEEGLFESGLDFTILQPAPYMQNVLASWRPIAEDGVYLVPYDPATRLAMVDLEDVAEAAARVLTETGHGGATYELCGPGLLDQHEIAAALGRALGRTVVARRVPLEEWSERARASGLGEHAIETLVAMFRYYELFGMAGNPAALTWLLGRPPAALSDFARRTAAERRSGGLG